MGQLTKMMQRKRRRVVVRREPTTGAPGRDKLGTDDVPDGRMTRWFVSISELVTASAIQLPLMVGVAWQSSLRERRAR
jgi:hypothetical protein